MSKTTAKHCASKEKASDIQIAAAKKLVDYNSLENNKNPFGNLMLLPKEQLRKGSSLLTDVTGGHHNHKGAFETTVWSCRTDRGSVRFGGDLPDLRQEYQDEYSSECVLYCLRRMQCLSN